MNLIIERSDLNRVQIIWPVLLTVALMLGACSSNSKDYREGMMEQPAEVVEEVETEATSDASSDKATNLPNSLDNCTAFSGTFIHPFTGEVLKREVKGINDNGLCEYREEMPNGGLMSCVYPEETRKVMAQYYVDVMHAGPDSFSAGGKTYTIEGKSVMNPLDEVMNNGTCTITGY